MMHASNIQLVDYFITGFNYSANSEYDEGKRPEIRLSDFIVEHTANRMESEETEDWNVELKLEFMPPVENNVPYSFAANIVGFFKVNPHLPEEKVELYIETNATSVLYSTLREIISTMTAKGPYPPLMLPIVSFYETVKNPEPADD